MSIQPVKAALIGYGMIGREHARILDALPSVELVVVCDTNPDVATEIPKGISFTTDLDGALATPDLEAVWVCTPQQVHREVVLAALDRSLHVFCEKPIAASLADADLMITAAAKSRGTLVIGHTLRFDPDYIAVKSAVVEGRLGEIVQMSVRWNAPDYEGRIISGRTTVPSEMAIHDLDIMRWLAGDIDRVYAEAYMAPVVGSGPDAVVGTAKFASGAVAALDHNWIMPSKTGARSDHRLAVFGTEGAAYVEMRETPAVIFGHHKTDYLNTKYYSDSNGIPFGALAAEDSCFVSKVRDGRDWPLSLMDARSALVAALAMERSIDLSRPVSLTEIDSNGDS